MVKLSLQIKRARKRWIDVWVCVDEMTAGGLVRVYRYSTGLEPRLVAGRWQCRTELIFIEVRSPHADNHCREGWFEDTYGLQYVPDPGMKVNVELEI